MPRKPSRIADHAIRPLIEFYPLARTASRRGIKWRILDVSSPRMKRIHDELRAAHGLYIFYNSQCRAIYLGKAYQRSLWTEINSAFNRRRATQRVWKVRHPGRGDSFTPAYRQKRRIKKRQVYLPRLPPSYLFTRSAMS
jgi:hypothetical protein